MAITKASKDFFYKMFGNDALKKREAFIEGLPKLSKQGSINLRKVIEWQTNDELAETLSRLDVETPFIDEYMRTIAPIVRPISIKGVFDAGERNGRGIAMVMICTIIKLCHPAVDALNMSKRVLRLDDWEESKFQYIEGDRKNPTAILKIVYDIRIKKGF